MQVPRAPRTPQLLVALTDPLAPVYGLLPPSMHSSVVASSDIPGTGIVLLTFSDEPALRGAAAALRLAAEQQRVRYFVRDFAMTIDRTFSAITGPMELSEQVMLRMGGWWSQRVAD